MWTGVCANETNIVIVGSPLPEVCPFAAPYGVCAFGHLFQFPCDESPFSAEWHFKYYLEGFTLTDTCEPWPAKYVFYLLELVCFECLRFRLRLSLCVNGRMTCAKLTFGCSENFTSFLLKMAEWQFGWTF